MRDLIDTFRVHLAANKKSPATIATYASIIEAFFASTFTGSGVAASRPADIEA